MSVYKSTHTLKGGFRVGSSLFLFDLKPILQEFTNLAALTNIKAHMSTHRFILFLFSVVTSIPLFAQVKVACIGNSVTYGYGIENRETNSYPAQLQQLLGSEYEVQNFGKSGSTLLRKGHRPYNEQDEYQAALQYKPDIAVIHLGLNDTDPRNWPEYQENFIPDYLQLIQDIKASNPKVRVLICRLSPITDKHSRFKSGTRDWYWQIQQQIEQIAATQKLQLIDLQEILYNRPELLPDAIHPNAEGASLIAKRVYSSITGDFGGLALPLTFSDNMVLQRDMPLTLSGTANKGTKVSIEIAGKKAKTTTADNGKWTLTLPPLQAGGPYILEVKADKETKKFKNVMVGEVWLCSGQSNMAWMLKQSKGGKQAIEQSNNPNIRLLNMQPRWETYEVEWPKATMDSLNRLQYYKNNGWQESSPATAADFSAIAYYFGQMLQDSLQVPVGLILNAVGGSNTESWIDRKSLEHNHQLVDILKDWTQNDMIQQWCRQRGAKNIKQSEYKEQRHPYQPCYLFEAGILPLQKYPVRGVLWYQGESNAHNIEIHEALFTQLVDSWRTNWNQNLPFYFVQLSSLNRPSWPRFRDSQRKLAHTVPNTYMVVSSDKGDSLDVHPTDKQPVGQRLALQALKNSYGRNQLTAFGPDPSRIEYKDKVVEVTFNNATTLQPAEGDVLIGFEIAGSDGMYYPASATTNGNKVTLKANEVKQPVSVRYGWQPFTRANLVNEALLPASTFSNQK